MRTCANPGEIWYRKDGALVENQHTIPANPKFPYALMSATVVSGLARPAQVMILGVDSVSVDGTVFYNVLNLKNNLKVNLDFPQLEKHYTLIYPTEETAT